MADPSAWDAPCATSTWTALHCAARHDDTEALGLLLEHGASVDARATRGVTALHYAAFNGRLAACQLLLTWGAEVAAVDEDGYTPLDDAAYSLQRARVAFRCDCVRQAGEASERRSQLEAIAPLLEAAAALPPGEERRALARRGWEQTAGARLRAAAERGDTRSLARLLERGGDVDARDCDGSAATHAAAEVGHAAAVALLLDHGAALHARTNYLDTPLHAAAHEGRLGAAALLLARRADACAANRFHVTPRAWAERARQRQWQTVALLLRAVVCMRGGEGRQGETRFCIRAL